MINTKFVIFTNKGVAPTVAMTPNASAIAAGKHWNDALVEVVNKELINELPLSPSAPGGMILYRRSLTLSLFFKAFLHISQELDKRSIEAPKIIEKEKSGANIFHTLIPKNTQLYEKVPNNQPNHDPVGKPKVHLSGKHLLQIFKQNLFLMTKFLFV